jgi:hypothetical protein
MNAAPLGPYQENADGAFRESRLDLQRKICPRFDAVHVDEDVIDFGDRTNPIGNPAGQVLCVASAIANEDIHWRGASPW